MGSQGGFFESVSDQQHADERCCCGRQNRVVLTPRRWRQVSRSLSRPDRAVTKTYPRDDGGKRARSPERARHKLLKPLRAGMPGVPVYSLSLVCVLLLQVHTRPRVQRAPGIPHALQGAKDSSTTRAQRAAGSRSRVWNCFSGQQTPRRPGQAKRDPGPITTKVHCCAKLGPRFDPSLASAAMGPGLRRDDERVRTGFPNGLSVIASRNATKIQTPSFRGDANGSAQGAAR